MSGVRDQVNRWEEQLPTWAKYLIGLLLFLAAFYLITAVSVMPTWAALMVVGAAATMVFFALKGFDKTDR